jgi:hypothetical protein
VGSELLLHCSELLGLSGPGYRGSRMEGELGPTGHEISLRPRPKRLGFHMSGLTTPPCTPIKRRVTVKGRERFIAQHRKPWEEAE